MSETIKTWDFRTTKGKHEIARELSRLTVSLAKLRSAALFDTGYGTKHKHIGPINGHDVEVAFDEGPDGSIYTHICPTPNICRVLKEMENASEDTST